MVRFAMVRERGETYGGDVSEGLGVGSVQGGLGELDVKPGHAPVLDPDSCLVPDPGPATEPGPLPAPDPFSDPDALEDLGDEIATIAARIHQATHRLLVLLAEFDRRRGWELGGHRSAAHWLSFRTGIDLGAARERVRAARTLTELPQISVAMSRGELSFSKVRALTRAATPENESELLAFATESTTASLERLVRGWKKRSRREEADWERMLHETRTLAVFSDDEGMYVVRGRLDPEVGALLMRALEAAGDALFRERGGEVLDALRGEEECRREAAQRRADAMGLLAERAMGAGFGEGAEEGGSEAGAGVGADALVSEAPVSGTLSEAPISGTRAERYQVVLHVDPRTLSESDEPGQSELEDGTRWVVLRPAVSRSERFSAPRNTG
ncbi:MAG: DUF222 domain-containing protein [Gemmatimonadota bacterium]